MSIIGGIATVVLYVAPMGSMPEEVRSMQGEVRDMAKVQAIQTEALKTLAEVAKDSRQMRRDVDRNQAELEHVRRRLDSIERQR